MNNLPIAYEAASSIGSTLSNVVITHKAVEEKLRMLSCNKPQGPDRTLIRVLKELALPVSISLNKSI